MKSVVSANYTKAGSSLPSRGAWIEIIIHYGHIRTLLSLPSRGAWIEISHKYKKEQDYKSLPSRGAWIEIDFVPLYDEENGVAPLAGSVD